MHNHRRCNVADIGSERGREPCEIASKCFYVCFGETAGLFPLQEFFHDFTDFLRGQCFVFQGLRVSFDRLVKRYPEWLCYGESPQIIFPVVISQGQGCHLSFLNHGGDMRGVTVRFRFLPEVLPDAFAIQLVNDTEEGQLLALVFAPDPLVNFNCGIADFFGFHVFEHI